jgi:ribosomal protein S18 acetylase RimI-like enzyme
MSWHGELRASARTIVRRFQAGDETAFRLLNEQWIERYFKIEAKDQRTLSDPRKTIIEPGGAILLATANGRSVGCCALLRISDHEFEVAKMAVAPEFQGRGIGRTLLSATIEEARSLGATRLYLETNHVLKPAIALYESLGFRHIDPTNIVPSVYARADVYMEMFLNA